MSYNCKDLVNKLSKLGDRLHLNREQALTALETSVLPGLVEKCSDEEREQWICIIIDVLKLLFNSKRWEDRFGAVCGSAILIKFFYREDETDPTLKYFVWNTIRTEHIGPLLIDPEFRVRNQLGELLREMISHDQLKGKMHFSALQETLLKNIEETFTREINSGGQDASANPLVLHQKKITAFEESGNKTMHDTEGWKSLETSMRILQNIIQAMGPSLYDFGLDRVVAVILKGVDHINRFVREISYFVINAIFLTSKDIFTSETHILKFREYCDQLVPIMA